MGKRKNINIRTTRYYHDYFSRLKNIALAHYEWELPETCNARFLEKCLFRYGVACLVNDNDMGYLNLNVTANAELNVYEEPISYRAYSLNYDKSYNAKDIVIIRNNILMKSTECTLDIYAERLAKVQMSIDMNINAQKTPILLKVDDKIKMTVEAIYNQYEGDKPVIVSHKSLMEKPIEVLKTDAPFVADRLREEKRAIWNEALEYLGFNTNPSDKKKERLLVDEVGANNEQIDIQNNTFLLTRKEACKEAFDKFGIEIIVRERTLEEVLNVTDETEEGGEDGEIYD